VRWFLRLCLPLLLISATNAWSQSATEPDPRVAPPAIAFPDWKLESTYEVSREYSVSFPSAVTTEFPENNVVPLKIFVPVEGTGPFPIVLVAHYWGASDLRSEVSLANELVRKGIACAIITLPYHLSRTPAKRRSGELAVVPDVPSLRRTMYQSLQDARRALDFLNSRPEFKRAPLGMSGTSLGAIVTAFTYAVDDRVSHAAFLLGGIDLADVLWNSSRVVQQREVLRRNGYSESRLRTELASVEPRNYLPRTAPGSAFAISGKFDTVIPEKSSSALISGIPGAKTLTINTGHYGGIFVQRRLLREIADFFGTEFSGVTYVPPKRIYAPTIRLGVSYDTRSTFDVGAGVDLWHQDRNGKNTLTLFASPRGLSLWAIHELRSGLSVGIAARVDHISLGILWSTVL